MLYRNEKFIKSFEIFINVLIIYWGVGNLEIRLYAKQHWMFWLIERLLAHGQIVTSEVV